jgi:hypothetical protein
MPLRRCSSLTASCQHDFRLLAALILYAFADLACFVDSTSGRSALQKLPTPCENRSGGNPLSKGFSVGRPGSSTRSRRRSRGGSALRRGAGYGVRGSGRVRPAHEG